MFLNDVLIGRKPKPEPGELYQGLRCCEHPCRAYRNLYRIDVVQKGILPCQPAHSGIGGTMTRP